jgi:cation transport ATPase
LGKVATIVKNEPVIMFLYGLLGVILIVPIALMLVISIIGIALIPIELLAFFLAALIGYIAVAIIIGKKILRALKNDDPNVVLSAVLGVLLLWLVGLIPFVGGIVKGIACITGLGAVIIAVARRNKKTEDLVVEAEPEK